MVTIQNLEVRFEVAGDDHEVFARLFREFMARYERLAEERRAREARAERDRRIGDGPQGGT